MKSGSALHFLRQRIQTKQCVSWDTWDLTPVWICLKLWTTVGQAARSGPGLDLSHSRFDGVSRKALCKEGKPQNITGIRAGVGLQPPSIRRDTQVTFPTRLDQDLCRACGARVTETHLLVEDKQCGQKIFLDWLQIPPFGKMMMKELLLLSHVKPKRAVRFRCLDQSYGYGDKGSRSSSSEWFLGLSLKSDDGCCQTWGAGCMGLSMLLLEYEGEQLGPGWVCGADPFWRTSTFFSNFFLGIQKKR